MQKPSILVITDTTDLLDRYQELLGPSFQVEVLSTIHIAETIFEQVQPHIIILDFNSRPFGSQDLPARLRSKLSTKNESAFIQIVSQSSAETFEAKIVAGIDHFCPRESMDEQLKAMVLAAVRTRATRLELLQVSQKLRTLQDRMKKFSLIDELTGLYNMRFITKHLRNEFKRAERYEKKLTVAFLEIHRQNSGMTADDEVIHGSILAEVGHEIGESIRFDIDYAARSSSRDFLIILPETDLAGAMTFAVRLQSRLSASSFHEELKGDPIFISIGLGSYDGKQRDIPNVEELIKIAEKSLKHVKSRGGGGVHALQASGFAPSKNAS